MTKTFAMAVLMLTSIGNALAENREDQQTRPAWQELRLWTGDAPGSLGKAPKDVPTLTRFVPQGKASGASVVICPGGGYGMLADHEGSHYALWLNEQGIAAFVLKYRLAPDGYRHPAMMHDVQRAIRMVRAHAKEWRLDPSRVGVMGSSAGGHLAATALTHFDAGNPGATDPIERVSSRPDLGILIYPVVTMGADTHAGSRDNLLGPNPDPTLVEFLSNEKQVTANTAPTFIFHGYDDAAVKVENSMQFAAALRRNRVPFALHIEPKSPHGIGLGSAEWDPSKRAPWTSECARWLKEQGF